MLLLTRHAEMLAIQESCLPEWQWLFSAPMCLEPQAGKTHMAGGWNYVEASSCTCLMAEQT